MQNLTLLVLTELKDDRVQPVTDPANGHLLFRNIGSLVEPIRPQEQILHFLEPDAALGICSETLTLSRIETKRMKGYDCYTTLRCLLASAEFPYDMIPTVR